MSSMTTLPPQNTRRSRASRKNGRELNVQPAVTKGPSYWSEYNDPEDKADDDYYIYVDPQDDASHWRFGYGKIMSLFKHHKDRKESESDETARLLQHADLPKPSSLEAAEQDPLSSQRPSSISSSETSSLMSREENRSAYGTFVYEPSFDSLNDNISPLLASSMALFLAMVLSVVLLVLRSVGRHRLREEVDGVVSIGIVISLAFGGLGAWGLVGYRPTTGRWVVVVLTYGIVLVVDAILATRLLNDVRKGI